MRARELELLLSEWTPRSKSDLDIRMRKLREAKLLPTGGRGPHAPHIGPREAAIILIAICGSRQAVDAAKAVSVFSSLVAEYNEDAFHGETGFLSAVILALSNPKMAKEISHVDFHLPAHFERPYASGHFPFGVITRGRSRCYYCVKEYFGDADEGQPRGKRISTRNPVHIRMGLSDDTVLEGEFLFQLAQLIKPQNESPGKGGLRPGVR